MKTTLRTIAAIVAGLVVAFILVIAVELFSAVVHPLPSDFQGTMAEMCEHVARYPHWVLAAVVPMWGFTAFIATWIGGRWGKRGSALFICLLLTAAVVWNVSMLPYQLWFKILMPLVIVGSVVYGFRSSATRKPLTSLAEPP